MSRVLLVIFLINTVCRMSVANHPSYGDLISPQDINEQHQTIELSSKLKPEVQVVRVDSKNSSSANTSDVVLKDLKQSNVASSNNTNQTVQNTVIIPTNSKKQSEVDGKALLRGFYVFIGLSVATLLYVMYRSYRIRMGGTRPTTVRKYGILTQRTDMEMLPLPLNDDEDDDTIFDVADHTNR